MIYFQKKQLAIFSFSKPQPHSDAGGGGEAALCPLRRNIFPVLRLGTAQNQHFLLRYASECNFLIIHLPLFSFLHTLHFFFIYLFLPFIHLSLSSTYHVFAILSLIFTSRKLNPFAIHQQHLIASQPHHQQSTTPSTINHTIPNQPHHHQSTTPSPINHTITNSPPVINPITLLITYTTNQPHYQPTNHPHHQPPTPMTSTTSHQTTFTTTEKIAEALRGYSSLQSELEGVAMSQQQQQQQQQDTPLNRLANFIKAKPDAKFTHRSFPWKNLIFSK